MPQFDQNANFDSLATLTSGAPAYQDNGLLFGLNPQTPDQTYGQPAQGANEDYELVSLLNPEQNGANTANTSDNNQPITALAQAMQQQIQLQQTNMQRDLEFRQQQLLEQQRREREEQQRQQLRDVEQQRQQLMQNLIPEIDESSITLTPEEQRTYGSSMDFVRKVATQAQRDILNKMAPGIQKLAEDQWKMQRALEEVKRGAPNNSLSAQQQQDLIIQAQVPNAGELVADPRFAHYKQQPSTVPGFTNGDLLDMAYRNGRSTAVIAQLKQFQQSLAGKQPQVNVQGMQSAGAPIQNRPRVQMLRRSEYDKAVEQYHMGLMDQETFDRIDLQFQTALVQGRVADQ